MQKLSAFAPLVILLVACQLTAPAHAGDTTISVGAEYTEGKYGDPDVSTSWTTTVLLKHETGPLTLKLSIPDVRSTGTAAAGGDRDILVRQVQSGLGDIVGSAFYTVYSDAASSSGIDLGVKVKFATADRDKELLTTGKSDYSLQADAYRRIGAITLFGNLGLTKKGEPTGAVFRDPVYFGFGFSHKLAAATSWGAAYDYRQRLTRRGDPVSEATLFVTHKISDNFKLQTYLIGGFSEASPDLGAGAMLGYGF